jgi:hypothetical protein
VWGKLDWRFMSKGHNNIILVALWSEQGRDLEVLSVALAARKKKTRLRHTKMITWRHGRNITSACQWLYIPPWIYVHKSNQKILIELKDVEFAFRPFEIPQLKLKYFETEFSEFFFSYMNRIIQKNNLKNLFSNQSLKEWDHFIYLAYGERYVWSHGCSVT